MIEEVLEAYNGLIGNWNIEEIISEIKNSWDREAMTDLFRISASLITTIESQNSQIESLKAITELAVKEFQFYADGANYNRHENARARTILAEIARLTHEA